MNHELVQPILVWCSCRAHAEEIQTRAACMGYMTSSITECPIYCAVHIHCHGTLQGESADWLKGFSWVQIRVGPTPAGVRR